MLHRNSHRCIGRDGNQRFQFGTGKVLPANRLGAHFCTVVIVRMAAVSKRLEAARFHVQLSLTGAHQISRVSLGHRGVFINLRSPVFIHQMCRTLITTPLVLLTLMLKSSELSKSRAQRLPLRAVDPHTRVWLPARASSAFTGPRPGRPAIETVRQKDLKFTSGCINGNDMGDGLQDLNRVFENCSRWFEGLPTFQRLCIAIPTFLFATQPTTKHPSETVRLFNLLHRA